MHQSDSVRDDETTDGLKWTGQDITEAWWNGWAISPFDDAIVAAMPAEKKTKPRFKSNRQAQLYVADCAANGDPLAQRAITYVVYKRMFT